MNPALPPRRPPPLPPRKPSHLQQSHPTIVHGSRQAKYNCSCGNNEKANICSCPSCHSILRGDNSPCCWYGWCVEPLAWNIEHELVRTQTESPLFTKLPKELREMVFEFALTADEMTCFDILIRRKAPGFNIKLSNPKPSNTIATTLLRTCREIYLETWTLPLTLNPYIVHDVQKDSNLTTTENNLLPWQLALVSSLDLTLQQTYLESPRFNRYLTCPPCWQPQLRHSGVYVAPLVYKSTNGQRGVYVRDIQACYKCALIPAGQSPEPRQFVSQILGKYECWDDNIHPPWHSATRVMLARPITRLTLRIQHSDWWTWTDPPDSIDALQHLALDPSVGSGQPLPLARPTAPRMRALAEARRAGKHPEIIPGVGWAETIGLMADLRELQLVLETFSVKKKQLDDVVEAAKTWKFPLDGTQFELVWDGEVGVSSWSFSGFGGEKQGGAWRTRAKEYDVRVVRFGRRRVA